MFSVFAKRVRSNQASGPAPEISYSLRCHCGHDLVGKRKSSVQEVACPQCRSKYLIFPTSPLVRYASPTPLPSPSPSVGEPRTPHFWWKPVLAGVATLLVVLGVFLWIFRDSIWPQRDSVGAGDHDPERIPELIQSARRSLGDGAYSAAVKQFQEVRGRIAKIHGESSPEYRRVLQSENEALLVADLSAESIPEIVRRGIGLEERVWQEQFTQRYGNRSILFDAIVHRVKGKYVVGFELSAGDNHITLDLGSQSSLDAIPLDQPRRLIFGVRLGGARRDIRNDWTVTAVADSVVVLTEPLIFNGSTIPVDVDVDRQLREQAKLLGITPAK